MVVCALLQRAQAVVLEGLEFSSRIPRMSRPEFPSQGWAAPGTEVLSTASILSTSMGCSGWAQLRMAAAEPACHVVLWRRLG